jgi:Tol biopolymer transport system component
MNKISPISRRCLFLLILALTITSHGIAQGFEKRIDFSSNRDGDWDIYSMDVNGDNLLQLTNHRTADEDPACSPDGRRIAFGSNRGLSPELYVMDNDGSNAIRLTHDSFQKSRPSWSPDGKRIAFSSFRLDVGNSEIYTMDADGNNEINLTQHEMHDLVPSWSPDGRKIAFVSAHHLGAFDARHIFVMNADGKGRRNLTGGTDLTDSFSPTWSPDGRKIAFSSRFIFVGYDIYVMTAEGKALEQLTAGPGSSWSPVYSPDGKKIAFASNRGGDANIFLMDANGKNAVNLTRTPPGIDNDDPSWPQGGLAVNPSGKLTISWGELKRARNPR